MTAQILDGKALAAQLRTELAERAAALTERLGAAPRLAIVSYEDEGPSAVYVRSVARAAERVGIDPLTLTLPAEMEPDDVERRIDALNRDASVGAWRSRTAGLGAGTGGAEILVVAAGRPGLIGPDMVSPGCVVIDCGITTTPAGVVGDVDFEAVREVVTAITPVPGGVGPVT